MLFGSLSLKYSPLKSVIKKFGHANIFALFDATEIGIEVASMKTASAILYFSYKHMSTMKEFVACCPRSQLF